MYQSNRAEAYRLLATAADYAATIISAAPDFLVFGTLLATVAGITALSVWSLR